MPETFYIIAAKRSDEAVPKLAKAMDDELYTDLASAKADRDEYAEVLGVEFAIYEFTATAVGLVDDSA